MSIRDAASQVIDLASIDGPKDHVNEMITKLFQMIFNDIPFAKEIEALFVILVLSDCEPLDKFKNRFENGLSIIHIAFGPIMKRGNIYRDAFDVTELMRNFVFRHNPYLPYKMRDKGVKLFYVPNPIRNLIDFDDKVFNYGQGAIYYTKDTNKAVLFKMRYCC